MGSAASVPSSRDRLRRIGYVKLFLASKADSGPEAGQPLYTRLLNAFEAADQNGDGNVSAKELMDTSAFIGVDLTLQHASQLTLRFPSTSSNRSNGVGEMDYISFCQFITSSDKPAVQGTSSSFVRPDHTQTWDKLPSTSEQGSTQLSKVVSGDHCDNYNYEPAHDNYNPAQALAIGTEVEARYGGDKKWFSGAIVSVHALSASTDTVGAEEYAYEIRYDDGDTEEQVPRYRVRCAGDLQPSPPELGVGERVDVRYQKGEKFYPARITGVPADFSVPGVSIRSVLIEFDRHLI
jgi:hypothetical protein